MQVTGYNLSFGYDKGQAGYILWGAESIEHGIFQDPLPGRD